jgi:hypothetical protein
MERDREDLRALANLADDLLEQAAMMRRQWTELAQAVGLEGADRTPPSGSNGAGGGDAERMRLVALDMVLSGASRDDVAEHLHRTFGADDVDDVVDQVFAEYGE